MLIFISRLYKDPVVFEILIPLLPQIKKEGYKLFLEHPHNMDAISILKNLNRESFFLQIFSEGVPSTLCKFDKPQNSFIHNVYSSLPTDAQKIEALKKDYERLSPSKLLIEQRKSFMEAVIKMGIPIITFDVEVPENYKGAAALRNRRTFMRDKILKNFGSEDNGIVICGIGHLLNVRLGVETLPGLEATFAMHQPQKTQFHFIYGNTMNSEYIEAIDLIKKHKEQYTNSKLRATCISAGDNFTAFLDDIFTPKKAQEVSKETLKEEGNAFFKNGKFSDAIGCYNNAIKLDGKFKEAWLNMGMCHQRLSQNPEALGAFTQAIELDPNYVKAILNKAKLLDSLQDFELALETLACYLKQGGNDKCIIALYESVIEKQKKPSNAPTSASLNSGDTVVPTETVEPPSSLLPASEKKELQKPGEISLVSPPTNVDPNSETPIDKTKAENMAVRPIASSGNELLKSNPTAEKFLERSKNPPANEANTRGKRKKRRKGKNKHSEPQVQSDPEQLRAPTELELQPEELKQQAIANQPAQPFIWPAQNLMPSFFYNPQPAQPFIWPENLLPGFVYNLQSDQPSIWPANLLPGFVYNPQQPEPYNLKRAPEVKVTTPEELPYEVYTGRRRSF